MPPERWMVCTTQVGRERWAADNAAVQGFRVYYPRLLRQANNPRRFIPAPVFPGYLFILWSDAWHRLLSTFGVTGLLRRSDGPETITQKVLDQLRAREDEHGFVVLPKMQPGTAISIRRGAMQGVAGLYQGMAPNERCRVLLNLLGRKVQVLVDADNLEVA